MLLLLLLAAGTLLALLCFFSSLHAGLSHTKMPLAAIFCELSCWPKQHVPFRDILHDVVGRCSDELCTLAVSEQLTSSPLPSDHQMKSKSHTNKAAG